MKKICGWDYTANMYVNKAVCSLDDFKEVADLVMTVAHKKMWILLVQVLLKILKCLLVTIAR